MVDRGEISFRSFTLFTKELEHLCNTNKNIMDVPLMRLLKGVFGYTAVSLSNYACRRFNGVEIIGENNFVQAKEYYETRFQKKDPFAAHISKTCASGSDVSVLPF
ncbi:MAG: hypothetical protein LBT26_05135 [Clostridiales Family XIII bacterium]|nr:hypothetical protein [Clostridiales Family XIII bacterium]